MARIPAKKKAAPKKTAAASKQETEAKIRSRRPRFIHFNVWIIGDTPLICHAWSEKARRAMLINQLQEITPEGVEARDPHQDYIDSLYDMGDGIYGFPVTAVKRAMVDSAHKDRGIIRENVKAGLWFDHTIIRLRPGLAGAICDMPLISLVAGKPEMREDMVRVGVGLNRKANLAYRGQFFPWAINLTGRMNAADLDEEALVTLLDWAGFERGIGDWRNEKNGLMGAFHPAEESEVLPWERFRSGDGPIPMPANYRKAA